MFWDLESCPLNAEPPSSPSQAFGLTGFQHFDLLASKLGTECGVRLGDFHLTAGTTQATLALLPEAMRQELLTQSHSTHVTLVVGDGSGAWQPDSAACASGEDVGTAAKSLFLLELMEHYTHTVAQQGDVLVLISGGCAWPGCVLMC